jgi:predicted DsbA family dithiol-disulfide isomerase
LRHIEVVHARYYTDPFCPWSWALEPARQRLQREFGAGLRLTFVMGGMRQELEHPQQVALQALEASAASGMPVDVRLWLRDPPRSSHAACIAVKAATEQGDPGPYLRRLREAGLCRQRKLEGAEELIAEARSTPGLDLDRFKLDIGSNAVLERFGADLDRAQAVPEQHRSDGRVVLPSLEFVGPDGAVSGVYGFSEFGELSRAAAAAGATAGESPAPTVEQALRELGPLAAAEVSAVCELPGPAAQAELWRLAAEWKVRPERLGSGELWSLA